MSDVEDILKDQKRVTPGIVKSIVDIGADRKGVIIFTSTIRHAEEILSHLPRDQSALVIGDTPGPERDAIVTRFKEQRVKFLVNVSVLTTGFDAPHVDLIAILRPTESVSLYQQIVGRGLRLSAGKKDCLILDYTGVPYDVFSPEIAERKPNKDSVPVKVECPMCKHENDFWGLVDTDGDVIEHYGRKCRGAIQDPNTLEIIPCGFRYRFRNCDKCGAENDISAQTCCLCGNILVDNDTKLREAMNLKDAHVLRPDTMTFEKKVDKKGNERLEIRYYDVDAQHLSEIFYIESTSQAKAFYYNFIRMHSKLPEKKYYFKTIDDIIAAQKLFRMPMFIIARKQKHFWKIREKIFFD
jgi:DNA repair protein RadD